MLRTQLDEPVTAITREKMASPNETFAWLWISDPEEFRLANATQTLHVKKSWPYRCDLQQFPCIVLHDDQCHDFSCVTRSFHYGTFRLIPGVIESQKFCQKFADDAFDYCTSIDRFSSKQEGNETHGRIW